MADIDKMIDQEGPPEGSGGQEVSPRELSTPTQDEDPNPIEGLIHTLAPGVSASGVQAAASALKGFVPMATTMSSSSTNHTNDNTIDGGGGGGNCDTEIAVDEISDEELQEVEEDLGNIAVAKPVQDVETSGRLSSVSSISNNSENETENNPAVGAGGDTNGKNAADQEDELSLSGLSSSDELKIDEQHKSRSDVEDGEINEQHHLHNNQSLTTKQNLQSKDSSDSSDQENENRKRRRFRKRSTGSENQRSRSKSSDSDRPISPRQSSPRSFPSQSRQRKQRELPRYDVRNVINRKRANKDSRANKTNFQGGSKSKSPPSRSRSRSRSRPRVSKRVSKSPLPRRSSRSPIPRRSRSPVSRRSRSSASRTPPRRSRSPLPRRSLPPRRSRSRNRKKNKNRSVSRSRSRSLSKSKSRSPPLRSRSRNTRKRSDRSWSRSPSRSPIRRPIRKRIGRIGNRRQSISPVPPTNKKNKKNRSRSRTKTTNSKKNRATSRSRSISRSPVRTTKSKKTSKNKTSNKRRVISEDDPNNSAAGNGNTTTSKKSKKTKKNKDKNRSTTSRSTRENNLLFNNSSVADKEVFTSGDKIMVSVNFKNAENKSASEIAATKKPSMVIDILQSPYQVIEQSPEPIVELDVFSDEETSIVNNIGTNNKSSSLMMSNSNAKENNKKSKQTAENLDKFGVTEDMLPSYAIVNLNEDRNYNNSSSLLAKDSLNSESSMSFQTEAKNDGLHLVEHLETHKGPCTPPNAPAENLDLAKGPQTPDDFDSYDPCDPTDSPPGPNGNADNDILLHSSSSSDVDSPRNEESLLKTAASTVPFLMEDSLIQSVRSNGKMSNHHHNDSSTNNGIDNNDSLDQHPVDMDMDSPFSPPSSEGSDIFEPPSLHTPSKKKGKSNGIMKSQSKFGKAGKKNKNLKMKVVDDKLKIIDDVPTSAVEMAVKEKFLKKVQRQERCVEEIKTVLKPFYNRKRINKEDYKNILRKCVPKVCHSKKGDINPTKIQKLVKGYVRKYHHARKRGGPFPP